MPLRITSESAGSKELCRIVSSVKDVEEAEKEGPETVVAYLNTSAPVEEVKTRIALAIQHIPDATIV